jgi:hypothetical protein
MRFMTILCLMLVATKFGTSLAHVAELPGKLRLNEATYKAVQPIYYLSGIHPGRARRRIRRNDRACGSALPDAVWNESILVDRRRTSISAGRARNILADDPSGEQLLGQGRCHVGTGLHLLLYFPWSAHGRLDGAAQYLGPFARRYIRVRHAQPALDSRGYVFHRGQDVRAAGGLKCVAMGTRAA